MTESISSASSTERVRIPCVESAFHANALAAEGMRPGVGRNPTTPQNAAGVRTDPPKSVPWARGTRPAATAAAEPPLEPPALNERSWGLAVEAHRRLTL